MEQRGQFVLTRLWSALRGGAGPGESVVAETSSQVPTSGASRDDPSSVSSQQEFESTRGDSPTQRIIYDVGANNGDDLPYYLKKADLVIAIEADPSLAHHIRDRFASEVQERRLIVENCVVTVDDSGVDVPFYLHLGHNVLSQFGRPPEVEVHNFKEVLLPAKRLVDIVKTYGAPYYMKIDVEGYDQVLLAALFSEGIRSPYVSAESHSVEVFAALVSLGRYNAFKLVNGHTVHEVYHDLQFQAGEVVETYSFPYHSAGPFGNDVQGHWRTANTFLRTLAEAGLGWADIHASAVDPPLE